MSEFSKEGITAPKGFKSAGVKAGIKKSGNHDVAVIYSEVLATAAVFTTNLMAAAPVKLSRQVAEHGKASAIVINSGCANACTGAQGMQDACEMARIAAKELKADPKEIFIASTGIIGVNLPMDKLCSGIKEAVGNLSTEGSSDVLQAIMTTDTFEKSYNCKLVLGGKTVRIAAIAKGAGMIHPNMATMLAFITTDAAIAAPVLRVALQAAVDVSFNMVSVDGDTSTNDSVCVLANGLAGNTCIDKLDSEDYRQFYIQLKKACVYLAKQVARDGEGATKFLEIKVSGAITFEDAKKSAMAIARSPLVKTAFFGQDPNWGRILCAIGYSGSVIHPEKVNLAIGRVNIVCAGHGVSYDLEALKTVMAGQEIVVEADLGLGDAQATVWTCDFSYDYVKINGDYHT